MARVMSLIYSKNFMNEIIILTIIVLHLNRIFIRFRGFGGGGQLLNIK